MHMSNDLRARCDWVRGGRVRGMLFCRLYVIAEDAETTDGVRG